MSQIASGESEIGTIRAAKRRFNPLPQSIMLLDYDNFSAAAIDAGIHMDLNRLQVIFYDWARNNHLERYKIWLNDWQKAFSDFVASGEMLTYEANLKAS